MIKMRGSQMLLEGGSIKVKTGVSIEGVTYDLISRRWCDRN